MAKENDYEGWKEIRGRVDSIANAVFLIAGGALSLSITVMLDLRGKKLLATDAASMIGNAWWFLLASIIVMLLNKALTVLQAYLLQTATDYHGRVYMRYNKLGWCIGIVGLACFVYGMYLMVRAASVAVLS
jgi:hypothetical protein